jgi:hypothetical protein
VGGLQPIKALLAEGEQQERRGGAGEGVGEAGDRRRDGAVEGEHAAPVVADQHRRRQVAGGEPGVEVAGVVGVAVGDVGLAGLTHADEIRREGAGLAGDVGDDVAPDVRRRRVAVDEHHRLAGAGLAVGHERVEDRRAVRAGRGGVGGAGHGDIVAARSHHDQ